jgi:predicted RND superfamily exporter protein
LLSILGSALIVAIFLRRVAVTWVVLSATTVPVLAGFGIWGWLGGDIGMAATLVIATTIGIVVDDTIHLAYRFYDGQRRLDLTGWGAAAYSVHKTGPALVATSIGLAVGFSALMLSEFQMNATFGVCTSLVVLIALGFNLVVSPRFLRALG